MQSIFVILLTAFVVYGSYVMGGLVSRKARKRITTSILFWAVFLIALGWIAFPGAYQAFLQKNLLTSLYEQVVLFQERFSGRESTIRSLIGVALAATLAGYLGRTTLMRTWWVPVATFSSLGAIFSYVLAAAFLGGSAPYVCALVSAVLLGSYIYWR